MQKPFLSFTFGLYNEEKILRKNLTIIKKELTKLFGNNFEIIGINNGSTDKTLPILKNLKDKHITYLSIPTRGLGKAQKKALNTAKGELVVLSAIDIPFGFNDLKQALSLYPRYDIIFGSKAHPKSEVSGTVLRKISSEIYEFFLRFLFDLSVKDPQGSIFIKRNVARKILPYCTSHTAFFSTQLAIYAHMFDLKIIEIPVTYLSKEHRVSKFNVLRDGSIMLFEMSKEFVKIHTGSYHKPQSER